MEVEKPKKQTKPSTDSVRVKHETKKRILIELATLNKKEWGRRVEPDSLIALALSLITDTHRKNLQDQTLTNKDRLEQKYKEYCRTMGKVSKDEFFGVLLSGTQPS